MRAFFVRLKGALRVLFGRAVACNPVPLENIRVIVNEDAR